MVKLTGMSSIMSCFDLGTCMDYLKSKFSKLEGSYNIFLKSLGCHKHRYPKQKWEQPMLPTRTNHVTLLFRRLDNDTTFLSIFYAHVMVFIDNKPKFHWSSISSPRCCYYIPKYSSFARLAVYFTNKYSSKGMHYL